MGARKFKTTMKQYSISFVGWPAIPKDAYTLVWHVQLDFCLSDEECDDKGLKLQLLKMYKGNRECLRFSSKARIGYTSPVMTGGNLLMYM